MYVLGSCDRLKYFGEPKLAMMALGFVLVPFALVCFPFQTFEMPKKWRCIIAMFSVVTGGGGQVRM